MVFRSRYGAVIIVVAADASPQLQQQFLLNRQLTRLVKLRVFGVVVTKYVNK